MKLITKVQPMLKEQAIRFLIIGILNTIVGYLLYAFFLLCGFNYGLALGFSTILGVIFNFKTIGALVFKANDNSLFLKFIVVYVITFSANLFLIGFLIARGLSAFLAGVVVIIPLAAVSFLLNKYFVFKR